MSMAVRRTTKALTPGACQVSLETIEDCKQNRSEPRQRTDVSLEMSRRQGQGCDTPPGMAEKGPFRPPSTLDPEIGPRLKQWDDAGMWDE